MAYGFLKQKGDIFGFESFNSESSYYLKATSPNLDLAPINNLPLKDDVERFEKSIMNQKLVGKATGMQ